MLPYFAYGSNLLDARLSARTPSARYLCNARLAAHRLAFHKAGSDDSAKCDAFFTGDAADVTHGVLYQISPQDKTVLDAIEGVGHGYELKTVAVRTEAGMQEAFTYVTQPEYINPKQKPFAWYHRFVLLGALERGFPPAVIAAIEAVETQADPNPDRAAANRGIGG
ncbi:gamma-glutamylcyclotransferase family protein [Acanthopleuribacter pedis]|uniref:Gamma-glutamylcyclotransferase n=1 Tax=Acanthopleuribacter pedis TaxID=442870 RepID=A0A8J7U465_9BACT|nr:gamma-glutamylcyclotransferase family protein [Acanthopleuribacter pedis]MBO1320312.1 gamma-glutamylcyclotransferase [Acanthopleuribacter pedis]